MAEHLANMYRVLNLLPRTRKKEIRRELTVNYQSYEEMVNRRDGEH